MVRIPFHYRSRKAVESPMSAALRSAVVETLEERRLLSVSLISVNTAGVAGNAASDEASVSSDGTFIAFRQALPPTWAGPFRAGVENIYLRDTATGTTDSWSASGLQLGWPSAA